MKEDLLYALTLASCVSKFAEIKDDTLYASNDDVCFAYPLNMNIGIESTLDIKSAISALKQLTTTHAMIKKDDSLKIKDDLLTVSINCAVEVRKQCFEYEHPILPPDEMLDVIKLFKPILNNDSPKDLCKCIWFKQKFVQATDGIIFLEKWYKEEIPNPFELTRECALIILKLKRCPTFIGLNDDAIILDFDDFFLTTNRNEAVYSDKSYILKCNAYKPLNDLSKALTVIKKFKDEYIYLSDGTVSSLRASHVISEHFKNMTISSKAISYLEIANGYNDDREALLFKGDRFRGAIAIRREVKCI